MSRDHGGALDVVRIAMSVVTGLDPRSLIKILRPAELDYLCEVCDLLEEMQVCIGTDINGEEEDGD